MMAYQDGYYGFDSKPDRPMPELPVEGKNYEMEFRCAPSGQGDGKILHGRCESVFNQSLVFTDFATGKRFSCCLADFWSLRET